MYSYRLYKTSLFFFLSHSGSSASIKCKCLHPADERRFLHFFSDFPHLIKNVRNRFPDTGYDTPQGNVHGGFIKEAWENDRSSVTLKVMPHISRLHLYPSGFEKMRVRPALRLFSEEVLKAYIFTAAK